MKQNQSMNSKFQGLFYSIIVNKKFLEHVYVHSKSLLSGSVVLMVAGVGFLLDKKCDFEEISITLVYQSRTYFRYLKRLK